MAEVKTKTMEPKKDKTEKATKDSTAQTNVDKDVGKSSQAPEERTPVVSIPAEHISYMITVLSWVSMTVWQAADMQKLGAVINLLEQYKKLAK